MKVLTPTDFILILIVLAGILLAIFVDIVAVKVIGGGLSIIFAVGLFMMIAQRQREIIVSKYKSTKPSTPNFNVTIKKESAGTRQTFENFMDSMKEEEEKQIEESDFSESDITGDEGFRIIKKESKKEKDYTEEKILISAKPKETKKAEIKEEAKQKEIFSEQEKVDDNPELIDKKDEIKDSHIDSLMEDPPRSDEPRREFDYCISRLLVSIRSVSSTRSALFFLVNSAKNEIKLEAYATDVPNKLNKKFRYTIGNDIVSSIIKNKKPEIVSEINEQAESELLPFYKEKADIKSFIGVPIFYEDEVIAVICADSPLTEAYDSVMVNFLGQLNKLITTLLGSYIEKYDLIVAYKSLEAIKLFASKEAKEDNDILWALLESASNMIELRSLSIVTWNEEKSNWFCAAEHCLEKNPYFLERFLDESSIVAKSIESKEVKFGAIESCNNTILSFDEKLNANKWYCVVPVMTENAVFGALVLLHSSKPEGNEEIETAKLLSNFAASSIEKVQLMKMLSQNSIVDYETGILNRGAFDDALKREFSRAKEFGRDLSLCLINIDKYASFEPGEYQKRMEAMIYHVIKIVNESKNEFDIFGKANDQLFGILLIESNSNKSKIFAEKLRNQIATSFLEIESKKYNITISLGVAGIESASSKEEFLNNSLEALKLSLDKTNHVSLFS